MHYPNHFAQQDATAVEIILMTFVSAENPSLRSERSNKLAQGLVQPGLTRDKANCMNTNLEG